MHPPPSKSIPDYSGSKEKGIKTPQLKEHNEISKIARFAWLRNVVKLGKYSLAKFANFVYVCITCGNCYHFRLKNGNNFRARDTNIYKIYKLRKAIFSEVLYGNLLFCLDKKLV